MRQTMVAFCLDSAITACTFQRFAPLSPLPQDEEVSGYVYITGTCIVNLNTNKVGFSQYHHQARM